MFACVDVLSVLSPNVSLQLQVPVEIRDSNKDKWESLEQEKANLMRAIEGLKKLDQ